MLVGILSMQKIVNYGSFMQAYSLKKMVESLGHRVVFVDYKTNVLIEDRNDKKKKKELFYQEIKDSIKFHILRKYGEQQKKFVECYPLLGISKFKAYHTKVDVLIVGSDEVFNCTQRNPKVGCLRGLTSNSLLPIYNAQNGVFDSMVSCGVIGTAMIFALAYAMIKKGKEKSNYAFLSGIYIFGILSMVEVTLNLKFIILLAFVGLAWEDKQCVEA